MSVYLLIILLSLLVVHIFLRYSRTGRLVHAVPGPPSIPILGNVLQFRLNMSQAEMWELVQANVKKYPVCKFWFLTYRMFGISHPDDSKILVSDRVNITKGRMYQYMEPVGGTGLVTGTGDKYHSRRKLIGQAFNPKSLERFIKITKTQGKDLIQRLKDKGDKTIENPKRILPMITLNIIIEWCMGVELSTVEKECANYHHAIDSFTESITWRTYRPYLTNWMMKFLDAGRRVQNAEKVIKSFVYKMLDDRRKYHESTDYKYLIPDEADIIDYSETKGLKGRRKNFCLFDFLLSAERDGLIDEEGIEEEIQTIVIAGFDTTATAMAFLLVLLAENKEAQGRARSEALDTLAKNGNELGIEQLKELDYIDRCIKESMRLFPPVPYFVRALHTDLHLNNYILPAGSDVGVSIYNIHRNPDFWPDPEKFDPDRFLPENVKTRHPSAYLPFSGGIRKCIGPKFAMAEMKVLAAMILKNFYIEPIQKSADIKMKMDFVLKSRCPFYVKFVRIRTDDH